MRRTNGGPKKIPLSGIKTLTFYADKYTAGRRTAPIRQSPPPVPTSCLYLKLNFLGSTTHMSRSRMQGIPARCRAVYEYGR